MRNHKHLTLVPAVVLCLWPAMLAGADLARAKLKTLAGTDCLSRAMCGMLAAAG